MTHETIKRLYYDLPIGDDVLSDSFTNEQIVGAALSIAGFDHLEETLKFVDKFDARDASDVSRLDLLWDGMPYAIDKFARDGLFDGLYDSYGVASSILADFPNNPSAKLPDDLDRFVDMVSGGSPDKIAQYVTDHNMFDAWSICSNVVDDRLRDSVRLRFTRGEQPDFVDAVVVLTEDGVTL